MEDITILDRIAILLSRHFNFLNILLWDWELVLYFLILGFAIPLLVAINIELHQKPKGR